MIIKYYCYLIRIIITKLEYAPLTFPAAPAAFSKKFEFCGGFIVAGVSGSLLLLAHFRVWLQPGPLFAMLTDELK